MRKSKLLSAVAAVALASSVFAIATPSASGATCTDPVRIVDAQSPTSITFTGAQISRSAMATLWDIVAPSPPAPHELLGRIVAEDQDWLGVCGYPGIGIGAGSGWNEDTKNVTLWFWATQVDTIKARQSIAVYIGAAAATTTTTTTTTTTEAPTTTTTTTTTTLPASEEPVYQAQALESTTTTAAPTVEYVAVTSAVRAMSTAKVIIKPKATVKPKAKAKLKKVKCTRKEVARRQKCRT